MKKLSNKSKLIISSVLLAVFAIIAAVSVAVIVTDTTASVPNGVKLMLFLGGSVGFLFFFCFTICLAVQTVKAKFKDKRLIAAGLKQNPREDVNRKPIEYDTKRALTSWKSTLKNFLTVSSIRRDLPNF
ncbi:MAG: hypothetical protein K2O81_02955 [Clostridia bacterium]|nr:hypothetical protein [Clostridia bacterium]